MGNSASLTSHNATLPEVVVGSGHGAGNTGINSGTEDQCKCMAVTGAILNFTPLRHAAKPHLHRSENSVLQHASVCLGMRQP